MEKQLQKREGQRLTHKKMSIKRPILSEDGQDRPFAIFPFDKHFEPLGCMALGSKNSLSQLVRSLWLFQFCDAVENSGADIVGKRHNNL